MADEPQVIVVIRIIFEVIWTIIRLNFQLFKAFITWIVPPEPKDVSEEIILITGAGHGMGREMALRFARLGATVVTVDINPAGNDETFKMIKSEKGKVHKYELDVTDRAAVFKLAEKVSKEVGEVTILVNNAGIMPCKPVLKHSEKEIRSQVDINVNGNLWVRSHYHTITLDVTDRAAVFKLADKVSKEVGEVTILVNNAGIMPCKSILKHSEKEIRSQVDINVNGNLWMVQAFLPSMLENNHGHIVAMSSMAGKMGLRNLVPYCGTKYAVRGIMEALAVELYEDPRDTSGIIFTTVYPYIVNTGLCHKPRIRFEGLMKTVEPGDAADQIVNAVRRNYPEITIPSDLYYTNKLYSLMPPNASKVMLDFVQTGLDAHD